MTIYLDSSALVKLVAEESESRALEDWLSAQPEPVLTSSVLARTEVLRAVRRLGPEAVDAARELLADLAMVALDGDLADHAGGLDPAGMPPRPRRQPRRSHRSSLGRQDRFGIRSCELYQRSTLSACRQR